MTASHMFSVEHKRPALTPSGNFSKSRKEVICQYDIINTASGWGDDFGEDATKVKLHKLNLSSPAFLSVWYDFGDDWKVSVTLEKALEGKDFPDSKLPDTELPRVLEGKGSGIIEDIGGIYGLYEFVDAFKNTKGARPSEMRAAYDKEEFDAIAFDAAEMNEKLKVLPLRYQNVYEKGLF
jgi:hypothetical protein